jgi:gentisate 1,2-dioxygenase
MATSSSQNFIAKLPSQHVEALWTVMHAMVPTRPTPKASVAVWRYADLRPLLLEAGKTVSAEQAERRVLMLVNPSLSKLLVRSRYCYWNVRCPSIRQHAC